MRISDWSSDVCSSDLSCRSIRCSCSTPRRKRTADEAAMGTRALVIHPRLKSEDTAGEGARDPEARLDEAVGLTSAIDLVTAHAEVVTVARPRPGTRPGGGQIAIGRSGGRASVGQKG